MINFYSTQKNELQGFSPQAQPLSSTLKLNPQSKLFALLFAFFAMVGGVWGQTTGKANVSISTAASSNGAWSTSGTGATLLYTWTPSANSSVVNNAEIQNRLLGSGVTAGSVKIITTFASGTQNGDVTQAALATITAATTSPTQWTFTIEAGGNITISQAINLTPATPASATTCTAGRPGTNVVLSAGSSGVVTVSASITTNGGLAGSTSSTTAAGCSGGAGGAITITGPSGIVVSSALSSIGGNGTTTGGNNSSPSVYAGNGGNGGSISLTSSSGGITVSQTLTANGGNGGNNNGKSANNATSAGSGGNGGSIIVSNNATTITSGGGTNDGITAVIASLGGNAGSVTGNGVPGTAGSGGGFTKNGIGKLLLSALNTFTGNTIVSAGTIRVNSNNVTASANGPLGNSANAIQLNGGSVESNVATFSRALSVTANGSRIDAYGSARTISSAISTTGTFTLTIGGTNASSAEGQDLTLSGIISNGSGTLTLIKDLSSMAILSGANTYTGGTTITAGTLQIGAAGVLADAGAITLNGGTLSTGASTGFNETVGTLNISANSTIALGTGAHTLTFAASNGVSWTASRTLTITGWTGAGSATGTAGKVFFGSANTGLTATQLGVTSFTGYATAAMMLSTGECVPTIPGCSGTPAAGNITNTNPVPCGVGANNNFTLGSDITQTVNNIQYQWYKSTDGNNYSAISGATSSTYSSANSSTANAAYYYLTVTCSNSGLSSNSNITYVSYNATCYCTPAMTTVSASGDYIKNFSFADITNNGTNDAPTDYTFYNSLTANVVEGQTYNISAMAGGTSSTYAEQFRVWIDYNQDGDFADAGESVWNTTTATFSPTTASGTVTIPAISANVLVGTTRMRIGCRYSTAVGATAYCTGESQFGEYEDYLVSICATPTISTQPTNSTICSGSNTTFGVTASTATGSTPLSYQWQVSTDGGSSFSNIANTGVYNYATTSSLSITAASSGMNNYQFKVIVTNNCGVSITSSIATLTVGSAPTASAGGSATICANSTATVAGASATNGTIAWTENGGGSITANSTAENPTYSPLNSNESNVVTLTMTVTGTQTGCTSTTATATYTVTVNPNPTITPGSNPSVCQGTTSASLAYTGMTNGGNQYSVNYDGTAEAAGFVDVTNSSISTSPISLVVPAAAATGTYNGSLTVRNSTSGCSSSSSYPITVTVNKVDVTMSANPQVCQGITSANVAFTIVEGTPNEYTIDFDATANGEGFTDITSYTNFSSSPIAVAVPVGANVGTYNGTITFRNSTTGCTEVNNFAVVVTAAPQVSNFSLSSSAVCAGFGNTITVTSSSLLTGTYTVTYNVSGANTANGLTSTLNFTAGSPGTGTFTTGTMGSTGSTTVTVTQLTSGCSSNVSSGNTTTYTVNASPATPTASYTGAGTGVCEGSPLTLSATGSTGTYTWSGPNSYAGSGATPTVNSSATTSLAGTYSVYATDNGCQSQTATTTVTVNTVGITLGANPSVCAGTTSANLPYTAINGSPSQYSIDYNAAANTAGFTDVSLATLSSSPIVLTVPSNPGAATYSGTLTVKNTTNGCVSNTSYPISVTVNALPTITLGTSPTVCRGAASANLTYSAQSGANQYAIDFDATAEGLGFTDVALTSLGASPVSVTTPTGATNGTYNANVTVKNTTTGCVSNIYAWTITLTSPTVTATASPDAFCTGGGTSTITAAGANTYLWSTSSTNTSITPNVTSTTTYTVTGTRTSDGCTAQATATVSVGAGSTLFSENFTSSTANSIVTGAAATNYWTEIGTFTKNKWYVSASNATCAINSSQSISMSGNGSTCTDFNETNTIILYKSTSGSFSTIGKANLLLNFDYKVVGGDANNYFEVVYSTTATPSSVANWTGLGTKYYNQSTATSVQVSLPSSLENQSTVYIGFKYVRAGTSTVPSIDNIVVTGFDLPATPSTPSGAVTSRCTNAAVTNTYTITAVNGATAYAWAIAPSAAGTISGTTTTGTVTWNAGWTGTATITAAAVNCAGTGSYSSGLSVTISAQPGVTTPTADQTVCANVAPSALSVTASGGSGSTTYQWYSNTSNSTTGGTSISGATAASYSPPASGTSGSTYYYCIIANSGTNCVNATSPAAATITVNPIPVGTSSLPSQSICSGQTTTAVSLYTSNNVTGTTFSWTRNKTTEVTGIANSGSGSSIAASTLTNTTLTTQTVVFTITPTGPASTSCVGSTYTVAITVTPGATVNSGSAMEACQSASPSALTLSDVSFGGSATDAAWSITSGTGTLSSTVSSATPASITFTPTAATAQTVVLTLTTNDPDGGGGCTAVSATKTITISPTSVAGSISGATTVCTGTNSTTLTLSGHTGSIQWQSSSDNTNFTNIGGATATTYAVTNLSTTTYYRAVVTSGSCSSATTSSVTMTVSPTSVAGTASSAQTICSGTSPVDISLSGNTGTIQWQVSTDNSTFTNIVGATASPLTSAQMGTLTATRYYRAVVTSGVCSASNSNTITVTVNPTSVGGTASSNQTICSGSSPSNITLSGNTGTIQWQVSTDNSTFNNIVGATASPLTSAQMGSLTATRYYRAVVTSGVCSAANSSTVTVTVNSTSVAGTASSAQTICSGSSPADITLAGNTGTIQWQVSTDNSTFTNIVGATASPLTSAQMGTLTATRYYRAVVTSGVCSAANSNTITVTVNGTSIAGSISGATTVCTGTNNTTLTLSGHTGTIQWQSSSDNTNFTNIGGATSTTYAASNLSATTYYRAVVTSGVCSSATTSSVTMTVSPTSVGGTASSDQSICSGNQPANLSLTGNTGTIQWQVSTDNSTFTNISGATASPLTSAQMGSLTATRYYRAVVTSGACSAVNSNAVTVTVTTNVVAGVSIASSDVDNTICTGTSVTFTATPSNGGATPSYQWKLNGSNVGSGGTTYTTSTLANNDVVTVVMTSSSGCATNNPATSSGITTTVNAIPTAVISGNSSGCIAVGTTLTASGGSTYSWSTGESTAAININPTSSTSYTVTVTTSGCTDTEVLNYTVNTPSIPYSIAGKEYYIWRGATSTVYETASNWYYKGTDNVWAIASVAPQAGNSVIIPSGTCVTQAPVMTSNSSTSDSLIVLSGATLSFSGSPNIQVNNDVVVNNGGTLSLGNGGAVLEIVDGSLKLLGNSTFTPGNGTIIFHNTATHPEGHTLISESATNNTFYKLEFHGDNGTEAYDFNLGSNINVTSELKVTTSNFKLNGYYVDLGTTGVVTEGTNGKKVYDLGSGYVTAQKNIPADGSTYNPGNLGFSIQAATGKPLGNTTIRRYHVPVTTNLDGMGSAVSRYYKVTPQYNGGSGNTYTDGLNATVTFSYANVDLTSTNHTESTLALYRKGTGDSQWQQLNGTISTSNKTLTISNFPRFSDVTLGGGGNPLPVELVSFSGVCEEGIINLTWQTASEFNSSHFDVEKSRDGENWQLLSTIPSAGTSNELITYQSADQNAIEGNNYFRLRQVDIDGKEKLYNPINVSCSEVTSGYFSSFPNPSGSAFQVIVNNKDLIGACTMNIVDASGKVIETRSIEVKDGINMFVINQELNPGIYFLNVTNGTKSTPVLRHAIK